MTDRAARPAARSARPRVLAGAWLAGTVLTLAVPGCYGRNCEGDTVKFTSGPGTSGRMISETQWESNPFDGEWLPFPRQRSYIFEIPELGGRPELVHAEVSASKSGDDYINGSNDLARVTSRDPNRVTIKNDTCSDYFLRLVVTTTPRPAPTDD